MGVMAAVIDATAPFFERPASPFHGTARPDRVLVLGLGNVLLTDEGIGVHAVTALRRSYRFFPEIDIVDGGTMGLDLLPLFQDRDRILIIDAVDFGRSCGHIATLEQASIPSVLNTKMSTHHIGLADLLIAARLTRDTPLLVALVGIQPFSLAMALGLSQQLHPYWDAFLNEIIIRLEAWGIRVETAS
jgi:hydrogenase maturation protease